MTILDWFDITNIEHIRAYKNVMDGKFWPKNFLPKDIDFPTLWFTIISNKFATEYINDKLLEAEKIC